jgi:hypothetical protein
MRDRRLLLDLQTTSNVRIAMKPRSELPEPADLSLWNIIERLQRRLERQGLSPASADRALATALRQLMLRPTA